MISDNMASIVEGNKLRLKTWPGCYQFWRTASGYSGGWAGIGAATGAFDISPHKMAQRLIWHHGGTKTPELLLELGWLDVAAAYEAELKRRAEEEGPKSESERRSCS